MVEAEILPRIRAKGQISVTNKITRIRIFGISESGLQDIIDREFPDWPQNVELGFRVQLPVLELKVATIGESLSASNEYWSQRLRTRFADYYLGENNMSLPQALNMCLFDRGLTLTTAESCTGGLIASMITSEAGSSKVFKAGFVSYANEIKQSMLGVQVATLDTHGAVSHETVLEMAYGALERSGSQLAVAVSGVAGPDGGTDDKPVGTVYLAFGSGNDMRVRKLFIPAARSMFQRMVAAMAIDLVRRFASGLDTDVNYYQELLRKKLDRT
jgi:nicotinamide-nucleotide amidase